jgi:hypothetical protein
MLAELPTAVRDTIASVYGRGAGVLSDDAGTVKGLLRSRIESAADRLGLLRIALQPTWGHGSFLRLAAHHERARREYAKRYPDASPPTSDVILAFLCDAAGEGQQRARFLASLRDACEQVRTEAVAVFDEVRSARRQAKSLAEESARQAEVEEAEAIKARARVKVVGGGLPLRITDEERELLRRKALSRLYELGALDLESL